MKKIQLIFQLVLETFVQEVFRNINEFLLRGGHHHTKNHTPSQFEVNVHETRLNNKVIL